ncbi:MAG: NUDIX domain-containing protein [Bacteroidales bacterium]|nr:NUDIX domain-containing protein [Bacteroidales bacterium]
MYKVFCDNYRLRLFAEAEKAQDIAINKLNVITLESCVDHINSWLEQSAKTDQDLIVRDSTSCEIALDRVFNWRYAAGGAVFVGGKLLSILRHAIPDLPKGHIDPGENAEQAAIREVCEETGIINPRIIDILPHTHHCYKLDTVWVLKRTAWYIMRSEADFIAMPQLDEGITAIQMLSEAELDTFFSTTFRAINEELSSAITLFYKSIHPKE